MRHLTVYATILSAVSLGLTTAAAIWAACVVLTPILLVIDIWRRTDR